MRVRNACIMFMISSKNKLGILQYSIIKYILLYMSIYYYYEHLFCILYSDAKMLFNFNVIQNIILRTRVNKCVAMDVKRM